MVSWVFSLHQEIHHPFVSFYHTSYGWYSITRRQCAWCSRDIFAAIVAKLSNDLIIALPLSAYMTSIMEVAQPYLLGCWLVQDPQAKIIWFSWTGFVLPASFHLCHSCLFSSTSICRGCSIVAHKVPWWNLSILRVWILIAHKLLWRPTTDIQGYRSLTYLANEFLVLSYNLTFALLL